MTRAFIFPGQGSQFVGMGKDLAENFAEARDIFESVDEILSQNLSKIMFDGPEDELNMTENTQPALMAVSMALVNVLKKQGGIDLSDHAAFVAGHSLGEYSALCSAGMFSVENTAQLLKLRGQSMQKAVPVGEGSMAAILSLSLEDVQGIVVEAAGDEICQVANDNSVGQVVISGHVAAIERAVTLASEKGAKRAIILPVSAPFHCALMETAAGVMAKALAETDANELSLPVVSNVSASSEAEPDRIRTLLVEQITGRVRWRESVIWMKDQGVTEMVELGAGKVLSGLIRRIDRDIACQSVGTPEQVEALVEQLK